MFILKKRVKTRHIEIFKCYVTLKNALKKKLSFVYIK